MRPFDSVSRPVLGGRGRGGGAVGDVLFFSENPGDGYIPITSRRVYADQYPNLAGVLQERRENDGGEWLRPGGILPNSDPSNGQYFRPVFGGVSAGENVLLFYSNSSLPVVARGLAAGKTFTSLASLDAAGLGRDVTGAVSDTGTIIMLCLYQESDYITGRVLRSTNGLRTVSSRSFAEAGLGPENANRFGSKVPSILSLGGNRWIIVNSRGDVYRSNDDGQNWTLFKTLLWNGVGSSGTGSASERQVGRAILVGSRIWVVPDEYTQIGGSELDTFIHTGNLFETYAGIRAKHPSMNRVFPLALGLLGNDIVLIQEQLTNAEASSGTGDRPIRGAYIADANPANAPVFFELQGTTGLGPQSASTAIFSWDGIGYMGLPNLGFYRVEPRSFARTFLSTVLRSGNGAAWRSRENIATFALVWSEQPQTLPQWSAELLQAVPSDLARRYYQFSEASVVGAQRADGKLPYLKAW